MILLCQRKTVANYHNTQLTRTDIVTHIADMYAKVRLVIHTRPLYYCSGRNPSVNIHTTAEIRLTRIISVDFGLQVTLTFDLFDLKIGTSVTHAL